MPRPGTRKPAAERKREDADAISYAFGHWIRLEALAILAEGQHGVAEMARSLGISTQRLSGHIDGLYEHGCIEYMGSAPAGAATEHFYRAVVIPRIDDDEFEAMPPYERRDSLGLVAQAVFAEGLASLRAGMLDDDENARIIGRCVRVDAQGKEEVQQHILEVYEQLVAIEVESSHRLARSRDSGTTTIVSVTAFKRSRNAAISSEHLSALEIASGRARKPAASRAKDPVGAVAYACGKAVRIGALEILAEGRVSVVELANDLGADLKSFSEHIRFLFDRGCIEKAGTEKVRNSTKHFYRGVTLPRLSVEDYRQLTPPQRRDVSALVLQRIIAGTLASFRGGQLEHDEKVQLIWDCLNLDAAGKLAVSRCLELADAQLLNIELLNQERLKKGGEEGISMVATFLGFERSRPGRPDFGYGSPREI
jgi:DNA-binding transcriptional ArsR family regulator